MIHFTSDKILKKKTFLLKNRTFYFWLTVKTVLYTSDLQLLFTSDSQWLFFWLTVTFFLTEVSFCFWLTVKTVLFTSDLQWLLLLTDSDFLLQTHSDFLLLTVSDYRDFYFWLTVRHLIKSLRAKGIKLHLFYDIITHLEKYLFRIYGNTLHVRNMSGYFFLYSTEFRFLFFFFFNTLIFLDMIKVYLMPCQFYK